MGEKKEYRSAIRSRKLIRQAFLELLQEKEYQKITVTDIVNRADINRATFYAHYPDVLGLLEEIENEISAEMYQLLNEFDYNTFFDDPAPLMGKVLDYLQEEADLYRILVSSDGAIGFIEKLKNLFEQYMMAIEDVPDDVKGSPRYQVRINYFAGGIVNIFLRWLTGKLSCSTDEIVDEMCCLLKMGM